MKNDKVLRLNQKGYDDYLKAIETKEEELRKIQLYKGTDAIYQGDNWHDNPTLYQTELKESALITEISKMKITLANAEIVDSLGDASLIDIGDTVLINTIYDVDDIEEETFTLVGTTPDVLKGEISINSPLGNALYQHKVGETVSYTVDNHTFNVFIKDKFIKTEEINNNRR